mmetsp:Transcript_14161/g.36136  ORF Transcript_14161/g.36136 Transcript_14161/m.36136 type:complete len:804 (-) Transcript_14161:73-2484(-)
MRAIDWSVVLICALVLCVGLVQQQRGLDGDDAVGEPGETAGSLFSGLRPRWRQPIDATLWENRRFPNPHESLPAPLITDIDGDGRLDFVYATRDAQLFVKDAPSCLNAKGTTSSASSFSTLPELEAKHVASLRSALVRLSTGRAPVALASGYLRTDSTRQHIVVLTEDWTVLCFDHRLRLVWESSLRPQLPLATVTATSPSTGSTLPSSSTPSSTAHTHDAHVLTERAPSESTLLLSPVNVYADDRGLVVVGVRKQVRFTRQSNSFSHEHLLQKNPQAAAALAAAGLSSSGVSRTTAHSAAGESTAGQARNSMDWMPEMVPREVVSAEQHFSYYAMDGRTGARRWQHEEEDFQPDSAHKHEREEHSDEQEQHTGKRAEQQNRKEKQKEPQQSIMQAMLAGRAFDYDTHPDLSPSHHHKLHLLAQTHGAHLGEVSWQEYRRSLFSALPSGWTSEKDTRLQLAHFERKRHRGQEDDPSDEENISFDQATKKPNVVLAFLKDGIEVVHLYTGRTLTRLPLRPQKLSLDLNGDGLLDQVEAITQRPPLGRSLHSPRCYALALTGTPPNDHLWNGSLCDGTFAEQFFFRRKAKDQANSRKEALTPIALRHAGRQSGKTWLGAHWDVIFLVSSGKMSCYHSSGRLLWQLDTSARWIAGHGDLLDQKVSLQPFRTAAHLEYPDAVLAVGSESMVVVSSSGTLLADVRLPRGLIGAPTRVEVAPPPTAGGSRVEAVTALRPAVSNSIGHVVITTPDAYIGYEFVPPATDLLSLLPYMVLLIAVALLVVPISSRSLLRQDTRQAASRKRAVD